MRTVEKIISDIRSESGNEEWSATEGISDNTILEYINDGKSLLQMGIINVHDHIFISTVEIPITTLDTYSIEDNVFLGQKILTVEYSPTGITTDYRKMRKVAIHEKNNSTGEPVFYIQLSGQILLTPAPAIAKGSLRVRFYRQLDKLDIKRGLIDTVTGAAVAPTALVLTADATLDTLSLSSAEYVSVIDKHGNIKMYKIPVLSYNSGSNTLSIEAGFSGGSGESVAAGDYVVVGKYATTHLPVDDNWEPFLKAWGKMRIFMQDSNADMGDVSQEMKLYMESIIDSYANSSGDVQHTYLYDEELMY